MAADLLAVLKYANSINYTASTLVTSAVDAAATCETPGNPTLAAKVPIDEEEAVALINCTRNMIGKEAMEKILHHAFWKGRDQGYKIGYDEGYHEAAEYRILDANDGWEAGKTEGYELGLEEGKKLGNNEEIENRKKREEREYENGWREGHETGLNEGKEEWEVMGELAYQTGKANRH